MKYLIFSELNRNHFLFLSYFIISIIREIVNKYITSTKDVVHTFHRYYIYSLSDFLSIIPVIIIKLRVKGISKNKSKQDNGNINKKNSQENLTKNSRENTGESSTIEYIYTDINNENNTKRSKSRFKFIILTSIFEFLGLYSNVTFDIIVPKDYVVKKEQTNSFILFNIISKYALSILILNSPVYRHHYLSLVINLICLIGLIISDIHFIDNDKIYFYALMKIISIILYSFEDAYAKILLSFDSYSPYLYLLYRGICVNILAFLYSFVFIFVKIKDDKGNKSCVFTRFWKIYDNKLNILLYLIIFFLSYLENLNIFLIIDKFSLIHFAVASIIENLAALLISIIYNGFNKLEFFIKIPIFFILIVSALVYNEVIILNFCGLQKYTRLFLQKIARKETNQSILNNINDNNYILEREMINMERNLSDSSRESEPSDYE